MMMHIMGAVYIIGWKCVLINTILYNFCTAHWWLLCTFLCIDCRANFTIYSKPIRFFTQIILLLPSVGVLRKVLDCSIFYHIDEEIYSYYVCSGLPHNHSFPRQMQSQFSSRAFEHFFCLRNWSIDQSHWIKAI